MILHSNKTYTTSLSEEALREALSTATKGWFNPYRLEWYPAQNNLLLRFNVRSKSAVAKGTFATMASNGHLEISYKPAIHPLLFIGIFCLIPLVVTLQVKDFTINNKPVSYGVGALISCSAILAFTALFLLLQWWWVTQIRESIETALKLK